MKRPRSCTALPVSRFDSRDMGVEGSTGFSSPSRLVPVDPNAPAPSGYSDKEKVRGDNAAPPVLLDGRTEIHE